MLVYIHLRDRKVLKTKAMYPIKGGFAFIDEDTGKESTVQFADIKTISSY